MLTIPTGQLYGANVPAVLPSVARLPAEPGVYRFRDEKGRPLYIGRAGDLRRRVRSYWGVLRGRRHLVRMVSQIASVEAVVCQSEHEAAWLERNLLEHRLPRWNRVRGGMEVPVWLRLDEGRTSASVRVVHEPEGRCFGPYLGGLKVRLAASALHRALSLAYAGDRLGGSDADMARARGVAPADRADLVRTTVAVLGRDPRACSLVRDELVRRRDHVAGLLLFEQAARIQAELEALDWVTAPQRVCYTGDPSDVDIHGYADGVLVSFEIRDGRMRAWSQRAGTLDAASLKVAATPAGWADFARRNAELAATLHRPM